MGHHLLFCCSTVISVLFRELELCNPVSQRDTKVLQAGLVAAERNMTNGRIALNMDQPALVAVPRAGGYHEAMLQAGLAAAERNMTDGRIILNMDQPALVAVPRAGGYPICSGSAPLMTPVRAKVGETAVFSCPADQCSSHNTTCADSDGLVWAHEGYSIWDVLCRGSPSPFLYSQTRTANTANLLIHNVTLDTTGPVYCYCQLENDTDFCVNQAFWFRPILTPADVFTTPVLEVSRPAGKAVSLLSELRIRLPDRISERYIFRFNGIIAAAPPSHPIAVLTQDVITGGGKLAFSNVSLTITFDNLQESSRGQYEVWLRPYMDFDEWTIQIINLEIT